MTQQETIKRGEDNEQNNKPITITTTNLKTCNSWIADYNPVKFVPMKNVSKHICETVQAIAMLLGSDPDERQCLSSLTTQQIERCGDLVKKGFKEQSFITLNHSFVRLRHVHNKKRIVPE